jgi:hypothetical protein
MQGDTRLVDESAPTIAKLGLHRIVPGKHGPDATTTGRIEQKEFSGSYKFREKPGEMVIGRSFRVSAKTGSTGKLDSFRVRPWNTNTKEATGATRRIDPQFDATSENTHL